MKFFKYAISISILSVCFQLISLDSSFAAESTYVKINVNLNIRKSANFRSRSQIIRTLKTSENLRLKVLEDHSSYYKVQLPDGSQGYIHKGRNRNYTSVIATLPNGNIPIPTPAPTRENITGDTDDHGHDHQEETTPEVTVPDNVQKYCKKGRYFYFENECARRGAEAIYCKDSRYGYHVCGSDPSKYTNVSTDDEVNSGTEDTGGRRAGTRGSCGPGIYVASPIKNGRTGNRLFGNYKHPILGTYRMHSGWDYPGSRNSKVIRASADGVVRCSYSSANGKTVSIDHGKGLSTKYLHLSSRLQCNKRVSRGTQIGVMGSTGLSTGTHLHFGVYCNGSAVNPAHYVGLSTGSTASTAAADQ